MTDKAKAQSDSGYFFGLGMAAAYNDSEVIEAEADLALTTEEDREYYRKRLESKQETRRRFLNFAVEQVKRSDGPAT